MPSRNKPDPKPKPKLPLARTTQYRKGRTSTRLPFDAGCRGRFIRLGANNCPAFASVRINGLVVSGACLQKESAESSAAGGEYADSVSFDSEAANSILPLTLGSPSAFRAVKFYRWLRRDKARIFKKKPFSEQEIR